MNDLTFFQALDRTVLDLGKLGEVFLQSEFIEEMEEADTKCFLDNACFDLAALDLGALDLQSDWNNVLT